MIEPLGDKIISLLLYIFAASWGLGWILLLLIMIIEKLSPNLEQKGEYLLKTIGKYIGSIMKYSLIAVGVLLLIQLIAIVANWLGWTKPIG
jgi:hypothetical protein